MNKQQISHLQQALWKLRDAQRLVELALHDTDAGQLLSADIGELMVEIETDLSETLITA